MQIDDDILLFLVKGGHLSPVNRKDMGICEDSIILQDELIAVIEKELLKAGRFPENDSPSGGFPKEGMNISRRGDLYVCVSQRTSPINPSCIVQKSERSFKTAKEAATFYLTWELCLPGRLDGITVI